MQWRLQFYNERDAAVESYTVEASTPMAAVVAGRDALRGAAANTLPLRRKVSGYTQAQRLGGHDAGGWILYRIVKDNV